MDLASEYKARRARFGLGSAAPVVNPEVAAKLREARERRAKTATVDGRKPRVEVPVPEPVIPVKLEAAVSEARSRLAGCYASKETKLEILTVLEEHETTWMDIIGPSRKSALVKARKEVCRLLHGRGWSYGKIGDFVNRDHTSVMHAVKSGELV